MEKTLGLKAGHFDIVVLIETTRGVLNAFEMASATKRVVGLLFGCEDYLAEVQGQHSENAISLHTPRSLVAIASRAAGVVPIDTPFVDVKNESGFADHLRQGRELGFDGLLVMTPKQIDAAIDVYTPDPEEVARANDIVRLADQTRAEGKGIAIYEGKFISPPTEKQARVVLARHNQIEAYIKACG